MKATTNTNLIPLNGKMTLSTPELMQVLSCGRATAVEIGTSAQSRIVIGRRVLWDAETKTVMLSVIKANAKTCSITQT